MFRVEDACGGLGWVVEDMVERVLLGILPGGLRWSGLAGWLAGAAAGFEKE